jgi:nicotinamidase-related amidase
VRPLQKPVLLVIDMQNDILRGRLASPDVVRQLPPALDAIGRLVDSAHSSGVPLVYSRIAFRPGHVDANPTSPARLMGYGLLDGDWGAEIIDELQPGPSDYIVTKKRASAFFGTDLDILLRGLEAQTLIVTGGTTNRAVESTVRDAHAHDYHSIVVSDATVGMSPELHAGSLISIADFFGEIASADEVVAALPAPAPPATPIAGVGTNLGQE